MKNRKLKFIKALKIFVTVFVICGFVGIISYADLQEEKDKKEQMESELKDTQNLLNQLEGLKTDSQAYITMIDQRINELNSHIYDLNQQAVAKQGEIDNKKLEIISKQDEIDKQYDDMALRIQYMYENGTYQYADLIFGSENMSDMLGKAEYIAQLTTYDRNMLEKLQQAKVELEQEEASLEAALEELNGLIAEAQAEEAVQEQLVAQKRNDLSYYESEIGSTSEEIENLKDDIKAQEEIIKQLEEMERKRKLQGITLTYDGGRLEWPLPGYSRISSDFGTRVHPITGITHNHSGIDLPAPTGTPIYAAYDGQVAWSNYNWSAGNWVGIDHGNGLYTVYMHMSKLLVSEGQYVKKGDLIGLVGSTGSSTGPHLHFSIRLNGAYVDPKQYVVIP